eukprot:c22136_g1_i1 orf=56-1330(-)
MPMFPFFRRTRNTKKKASTDSAKDASLSGADRSNHLKEKQDSSILKSTNLKRPGSLPKHRHHDVEDSFDMSRNSLYSGDQSSEVAAGLLWGSQSPSPSNSAFRCADVRKPLPLPPMKNTSVARPSVQPSIRVQLHSRTGDTRDVDGASGYPTDSDSSDSSSESGGGQELSASCRRHAEGESLRLQHSTLLEDSQRFPSHFPIQSMSRADGTQPGSPVGTVASPRLAYRNGQGEGGDLHIHIHVNGVQNSDSTSTFSSPVLSPRGKAHQEQQPWLWNPGSNHLQQASSPTSGQNSGHNSISSDFPLQQRRPSSDLSPRAQSSAVSPRHPLSSSTAYDSSSWNDAHPLPLPSASCGGTAPSTPRSPRSSGVPPRSPGKAESGASAGKWQKGCLLGSGSFGKVYKGIHSETGEFCAIKEVEFVRDDP